MELLELAREPKPGGCGAACREGIADDRAISACEHKNPGGRRVRAQRGAAASALFEEYARRHGVLIASREKAAPSSLCVYLTSSAPHPRQHCNSGRTVWQHKTKTKTKMHKAQMGPAAAALPT